MPVAGRTFVWTLQEGVGTIVLNRPERLNALTFEVYAELRDTFAQLKGERDVRVVIVTGAGKGFCSGGDVHDIIGKLFDKDPAGLLEFTRMTGQLVVNIRRAPQPVIAAVNGTCAGAGGMIALACDLRIAADTAKFAYLFTKVGLSGADMGACQMLPRMVGWGNAAKILLTGDSFDAAEAYRIGLVQDVVPADRVLAAARELAQKLAKLPASAIAVTKTMMNDEASVPFEAAVEAEAQAQAACMRHPDFREFYEAWKAKREPRFQ
jgi:enoyl-CoA hydratase/carnithine racemase